MKTIIDDYYAHNILGSQKIWLAERYRNWLILLYIIRLYFLYKRETDC